MYYRATTDLKDLEDNPTYKNTEGKHECVALVQKITNAPHTTKWRMGRKVMDAGPGEIPSGTVIATFDGNSKSYPSTQMHAAIYVTHNHEGIVVYDQWNSQGRSKKRTIRLKNLPKRHVDDASYYYVVE